MQLSLFRHWVQAARRGRRGNYSMLLGILVPVVFGFAAMSVDLTYMQFSEQQLQHVADAASHAAFIRYRQTGDASQADDAAQMIVEANRVGNGFALLEDVDYGRYQNGQFRDDDRIVNAARARVSRQGNNALDLFFAPVLGKETHSIETTAVTSGRTREIMIVQDITGSFRDDIDNARDADLAFLDFMALRPYPGDQIGMTTFVGGVEPDPWSPLARTNPHYPQIRAQWETLDSCNCTGFSFCRRAYGNNNGQPWMQNCHAYGGQTAPGPGIDQAIDDLLENGDPTAFQAIILVSDGLPCCGSDVAPRKAAGIVAADRAWENGIHVWSVAFNDGGGNFRYLESLVRGQGTAYETPDSDELETIMLEIARSIPVVLVE